MTDIAPAPAHPRSGGEQLLQEALDALDATVLPFGLRGIQEAGVRSFYRRAIHDAVAEIRAEVGRGVLTVEQAAIRAQQVRNEILELARIRSSELGRSIAEWLKLHGKTMEELTEYYARKLFSKAGAELTEIERSGVMREIIAGAARENPGIRNLLRFLGPACRGVVALTIGLAIYAIYKSPDWPREALHQGVVAGAGVGGALVGGLGATLACAAAAPVCVGGFILVGSVGGAVVTDHYFPLAADFFWRRLHPGDGHR